MDIYNKDYKPRKPRVVTESKGTKFDLNRHSGRLIAVGDQRWKWGAKGSKVNAISETGEKLVSEAYLVAGYSDPEAYEQDKLSGSKSTSIGSAVISNWIRRNKQ